MLYLRRIVGESMLPGLHPGQVVMVWGRSTKVRIGDVVIIRHDNREKIKRVTALGVDKIFIEGDNKDQSTDSRHFGWIDITSVKGKVMWPRHTRVRPTIQK